MTFTDRDWTTAWELYNLFHFSESQFLEYDITSLTRFLMGF